MGVVFTPMSAANILVLGAVDIDVDGAVTGLGISWHHVCHCASCMAFSASPASFAHVSCGLVPHAVSSRNILVTVSASVTDVMFVAHTSV